MAVSPDHAHIDFHYPPLDPERREFRLLTFYGRDELGMLHGRLSTVSLQSKDVKIIALSYEWGDGSPGHRIIVNDRNLRIRNNLHSFLESAAGKTRVKHGIFIDALCINQADRAERSNQVRLMPDIYSHAAEFRAWLGPLSAWWTHNPSLSDLRTCTEA